MRVKDFYFDLPEKLIAQHPLENRDESKLMVVNKNTGSIDHKQFKNIIDYLEKGDCLVLNDTRVLPARLMGVKEGTGGKIEFLLLKKTTKNAWEILVKPGKKALIGTRFIFGNGELKAEIMSIDEDGSRIAKFNFEGIFEEVLDKLGQMPASTIY